MIYPLQPFITPVNCQIFCRCAIGKVATALWRLPGRQWRSHCARKYYAAAPAFALTQPFKYR